MCSASGAARSRHFPACALHVAELNRARSPVTDAFGNALIGQLDDGGQFLLRASRAGPSRSFPKIAKSGSSRREMIVSALLTLSAGETGWSNLGLAALDIARGVRRHRGPPNREASQPQCGLEGLGPACPAFRRSGSQGMPTLDAQPGPVTRRHRAVPLSRTPRPGRAGARLSS